MADNKPTRNYYQNLGGINQKASTYEMSTAQFLDLRNLDFDRPNALQKRPGQTFAINLSAGTSGPIQTIYEFAQLNGASYVVCASDTALFYVEANQYTLLSSGWNSGQPPDMLTFVNKLWIANGQKWMSWDATNLFAAGLPLQGSIVTATLPSTGGSYMFVGGVTMSQNTTAAGSSYVARGVYVAYQYVRSDGYAGPADFLQNARNIVLGGANNATDYFSSGVTIEGITIPSGFGISGINLYIAVDTVTATSPTQALVISNGLGSTQIAPVHVGNLGYLFNTGFNFQRMSDTLIPTADVTRFFFYTTVPGASLFITVDGGVTYYSTTFFPGTSFFSSYDAVASGAQAFSGMTFDFFTTFIPKYIEINQNIMFASGFSSAPSTVAFSEVGEPETYLPENNFEVRTNDGDRLFGQKSFNNQMIFMKERSFHKLVGTSSDNFELVQVSTDYGCLSNKTILTINQTMYWLDRKGILAYNGASWDIASGAIELLFRRMNLSAAKEKACGVHHLYRNQLWWGIPIDGSTENNITIVYDYLVQAWTFFDGFHPASFGFVKGALNKQTVWRGDYSGMIHYFGESFFSDSGYGISCVMRPRFENVGGENQTTLWRRFFLDVAPVSGGTGVINGRVFSNYDTSTVQATFTIYQNQFQTRAEMGVQGKAVTAEISHFSASLPLLINGYAWADRPLRNV